MKVNERNSLIDLTKKAIMTNEELLASEKKFLAAISSNLDAYALEAINEKLSDLCIKEHLYLSASKSLLQIMNKPSLQ